MGLDLNIRRGAYLPCTLVPPLSISAAACISSISKESSLEVDTPDHELSVYIDARSRSGLVKEFSIRPKTFS